ncbi:NodT family efflux transporter outer membrane factor (OMF) lipoprotein [Duganella sp. 1224]|uniref:efflux transporter outer membrane subunit n=1 Tax=Duganella sp. 1224 TaxID=2587052 RepID=UPI0017EC95D0|nr:efflux transporter outer membrane subunit [Duganella sp. 1224]NYE60706.1 NodT family efflux transporter outer membrane factor (OMF) lipoprotein [Duganella sp. 1224]
MMKSLSMQLSATFASATLAALTALTATVRQRARRGAVAARSVHAVVARGHLLVRLVALAAPFANAPAAPVLAVALRLLIAVLVTGCAAGPDFVRPAAPPVTSYTEPAQPADTAAAIAPSAPIAAGAAQHYVEGQAVSAQWWTVFGSEALNQLVAAALQANPDLQAADAALRAASETAAAQRGAWWPTADLHLQPTRQQVAGTLSSPTAGGTNLYTLHTAQLSIGYAPDLFGATRRQVEAADAQTDLARYQRAAARLTLTTSVVNAAIGEAALRAQLDATEQLAALARQQLDAVRKQQQAGQLGAADVAAQEAALAQADAALPPLRKQLAQQRDLLAVLAGRYPSEGLAQRFRFEQLTLATALPLSLPAQLVEQRPDILAAEAQLHAAAAQVGIASAARLPNITLTGTLGSSALTAGTLFQSGAGFWSIGADLAQPLFRGGTLLHQQRAAEASYDQAAAQYRGVVLTAFQNVADTLHAIDADAEALRAAAAAEQAARRSWAIARRQWQLGQTGYPPVLQAGQALQQASIALIQAQASRYADTVALYQALGGGWR